MAVLDKKSRLVKQLSLLDVYTIATGATLSSGLFLLPGLAAVKVGPAVVLAYLLAAVPLIPAMFSMMELATAMPRAGGAYYFLDRSLGPLAGTVGGLGTWLALTLKTAFALVGMGAYGMLFLPNAPYKLIACAVAVIFCVVNLFGAGKAGRMQFWFVFALLTILAWFILRGTREITPAPFEGFFDAGLESVVATAGMVYISYVGVTKVASVAEEVKDPDRNLPLGIFLALITAVLVYGLCILVMTAVIPPERFAGNLTPMATAADLMVGKWGKVLISVAALLAFASVANAAILASSRYPMAMSRDHLLPRWLRTLSARRTPIVSILFTVGAVIIMVLLFRPESIAKLASAFQLLLFALICFAVIVMRESRIESYDPGYRSPLYPWMQIFGIIAPVFLIAEMGWLSIVFSAGLIVVGVAWYYYYARSRVERHGAIYHVFERLGRQRFGELDRELRGILKEKGLREQDPFVEIIARAQVIDGSEGRPFEAIVEIASRRLAQLVPHPSETLAQGFLEGTRIGATPISHGAALPHLRLPGIEIPSMVIVRSRSGVEIDTGDVLGGSRISRQSHAIFFLVSPDGNPGQHLRLLAELASRFDQDDFLAEWLTASDEQRMKEILLRNERYVSLVLARGAKTEPLIDKAVRELDLPKGCLVAVVRREGKTIVPGGDTLLRVGDGLAVIGSERAVRECSDLYTDEPANRAAPARG